MSGSKRRRDRSPPSAEAGRQEVERLIEKRRLKDAFKQAKLCFHQDDRAEHRRLLERVYLLRIEDLLRGGMPTTAVEVARHFLDFGVTDPNLFAPLAAVLTQLGMLKQAVAVRNRVESSEGRAGLSVALADRAVLRPDQIPASLPELLDGARQIRSALAALDADNEELASDILRDVPRGSPWADWRYFVRGLAAFRGGEIERAAANWERLDPQRPAHRIAAALRGSAASDPDRPAEEVDLSRMEAAVFGEPVLGRIERLRRRVAKVNASKSDWQQAELLIASLRRSLGSVEPGLAQRLTEILLPVVVDRFRHLSESAAERLVNGFIQAAEPLPFDPHWNRLWAVVFEARGCPDIAAERWADHAHDLEQLRTLAGDESARLQALVWRHVGELLGRAASGALPFFAPDRASEETETQRGRVVEAFERSLRLDPSRRETHQLLIKLHQASDQPEAMAAAARQLLQVFPEDAETLGRLVAFHVERDEPEAVLGYVMTLRRLKPLDANLNGHEVWARLALARHRALEGRWDEGRAEFARAQAIDHDFSRGFRVLARRAALEYKAGEPQRAEALISEARALLPDPAGLWLAMSIEASRYELPPGRQREFGRALEAALSKKKSGETAALLAEMILAYLIPKVDYEGLDRHVDIVVEYIERTSRVKYSERELTSICMFLQEVSDDEFNDDLLRKFAKRGRKAFPQSPVFLCFAAEQELAKGPFTANLAQARKLIGLALRQAEAEESTGAATQVTATIKRQLLKLDDMARMAEGMRAEMPNLPYEILDDLFASLPDGDDPDDDDLGFFPPQNGRAPRGRRSNPSRK